MAYALHYRCTARGTLGGKTPEIFSTGICVALGPTIDEVLATWYNAMTNWWPASGNHIWAGATITDLLVQTIAADGSVGATAHQSPGSPLSGNAGQTAPSFVTHAISFETGVLDAKNRPIRGRMFVPNNTFTYDGAQITDALTTGLANSGISLLNYFLDPGDGLEACTPIVASQTAGGRNLTITGASADDIADTIRTRKNQLAPKRQVVNL